MLCIEVTPQQVATLSKYAEAGGPSGKSSGGWQNLCKRLVAQVKGSELRLTVLDARRVPHYANNYGNGGWQNALRQIEPAVKAALAAWEAEHPEPVQGELFDKEEEDE